MALLIHVAQTNRHLEVRSLRKKMILLFKSCKDMMPVQQCPGLMVIPILGLAELTLNAGKRIYRML